MKKYPRKYSEYKRKKRHRDTKNAVVVKFCENRTGNRLISLGKKNKKRRRTRRRTTITTIIRHCWH